MRYLLVLLTLLVSGTAQAIDCRETPDCSKMGYSTADDPNCKENGYIFCPFDKTYKKCVNYKCEAWGFTQSDKSSWCASVISCKSNPSMTLCQKPCFATDYASLKELTESGDCKVVTMRNDIEIPKNKSLTLADNTTLDGNGHVLHSSSSQTKFKLIVLGNQTGLQNLILKHHQSFAHEDMSILKAKSDQNQISLRDISIEIEVDSKDINQPSITIEDGTFLIAGKLNLKQDAWHLSVFGCNTKFKNADVDLYAGHISANLFQKGVHSFENTTFRADVSVVFINDVKLDFKNTDAKIVAQDGLIWREREGLSPNITLNKNSKLSLEGKKGYFSAGASLFVLNGESGEEATLSFKSVSQDYKQTQVETKNTFATLTLQDKTYRPTKAATTLLSEVEKSENWTQAQ